MVRYGTHGGRSGGGEVLLVGGAGARPVERVGGLGDVEAVVAGVGVPRRRRARVEVGAAGMCVRPLRRELRAAGDGVGHPDGGAGARDVVARGSPVAAWSFLYHVDPNLLFASPPAALAAGGSMRNPGTLSSSEL